jgi:hypothetical protein
MSTVQRSSDNFLITDSKGFAFGRKINVQLPNSLGELKTLNYKIALDTLDEKNIDSYIENINDENLKLFLKKNIKEIIEGIKNKKIFSLPYQVGKDEEYILQRWTDEADNKREYNGAVVAKLIELPKIISIVTIPLPKSFILKNNTNTLRNIVIGDKNIIFKEYYSKETKKIVFYIEKSPATPDVQDNMYDEIAINLNNNMEFKDFRNDAEFKTINNNFTIYKPNVNIMNDVKKKLYGITTFSNGGGKRNNKKSKKNNKKTLKRKNNKSRKFARK